VTVVVNVGRHTNGRGSLGCPAWFRSGWSVISDLVWFVGTHMFYGGHDMV